jgi:hypothetical protein
MSWRALLPLLLLIPFAPVLAQCRLCCADPGSARVEAARPLVIEARRHWISAGPPSARLVSPDGSSAEAVELRTDLPPDPMLDASGELRFAFGGSLVVLGSSAGKFRGRIPIVADYKHLRSMT